MPPVQVSEAAGAFLACVPGDREFVEVRWAVVAVTSHRSMISRMHGSIAPTGYAWSISVSSLRADADDQVLRGCCPVTAHFPFRQLVVLDLRSLPSNLPQAAADRLPADTFTQLESRQRRSAKLASGQTWLSRLVPPRSTKRSNRTLCRPTIDKTDSSLQVNGMRCGIFDVTGQLRVGGSGMLGDVDSEPGPPPGRRQQINARLGAIRARLEQLRERGLDAIGGRVAAPNDRLEAAQRHEAEAAAAAAQALAATVEAFRRAAEAHERAASMHERIAAAGIGDMREHERQAALHRAGAAADRERAERARSLLSQAEQAGPAVFDKPGESVAP